MSRYRRIGLTLALVVALGVTCVACGGSNRGPYIFAPTPTPTATPTPNAGASLPMRAIGGPID
jgi:hypothetical protein